MKDLFRRLIRPLLERQVRRLVEAKKPKIVAVGGAVGKSGTKLAIAAVLRRRYKVLVHPGNFNMDISLPLAVFDLDVPKPIMNPLGWVARLWRMERMIRGHYPYEVLVLELGTDHPGEIPHFMTYLKPDIGVMTSVAPEHMEFFKDIHAVAREELALVAGSKRAVVNRDDLEPRFWEQYVAGHKHVSSYGLDAGCDYRFEIESMDLARGTRGRVEGAGEPREYRLFGRHSAKMLAAAYAVGDLMKLTDKQLADGLADIRPMSGRMNPLAGAAGSMIIDDTYNSSPEAALAALSALLHAEVAAGGRRVAIMGSMNELGAGSARYHEEVGAACARLDMLITLGDMANRYLGPAALAAGLDPARWFATVSPYAAGAHLRGQLHAGDVVLAKGSQNGVYAEEAVKLLLADPADAAHLVRQSPAWLDRKQRQFAGLPAAFPRVKPLSVERVYQQSVDLKPEIKEKLRAVSESYAKNDSTAPICVPACIFMVARAEGYLPGYTSLGEFVSALDWDKAYDARGWIRPRLTSELRDRYGWPMVSWWIGGVASPTPDDLALMRRSGYISTPREQAFFSAHIAGRSISEIVQAGLPVVVSVKPEFNASRDSHAIIITEWTADRVTVVDPDQRADRTIYDPAYVESYINPVGAGTVILPKE